jgi:Fur family ferric uptake transcriptional regulator
MEEDYMPALTADVAMQLRRRGYRLTTQRHLILDAIRKADKHVTPEQVYETVHKRNPAISRATIYRTLDFLCEMRLAVALRWGDQTYYEIAGETPHHHLICRACGHIQELDPALVDMLTAAVAKEHHFKMDMDHMALFGLCKRCSTATRKSRPHVSH